MKKISPDNISTDLAEDIIIYSETTVPAKFIDVVNEQYDCDYTVPRGLAMAMMRVSDRFSEKDYDNQRVLSWQRSLDLKQYLISFTRIMASHTKHLAVRCKILLRTSKPKQMI